MVPHSSGDKPTVVCTTNHIELEQWTLLFGVNKSDEYESFKNVIKVRPRSFFVFFFFLLLCGLCIGTILDSNSLCSYFKCKTPTTPRKISKGRSPLMIHSSLTDNIMRGSQQDPPNHVIWWTERSRWVLIEWCNSQCYLNVNSWITIRL